LRRPAPRCRRERLTRMQGVIAAFGRAARDLTRETLVASVGGLAADHVHLLTSDDGMRAAVIAPRRPGTSPAVLWERGSAIGLAGQGYLVLGGAAATAGHPERFLHTVAERGLDRALSEVIAGSFNLAVLDTARGELLV